MASSPSRPIFASDIDGTLLFTPGDDVAASPERFRVFPDGERHAVSISVAALDLLRAVANRAEFVPVTARSVEQYRRLEIFRTELAPRFAIVSGGGNLLVDGEIDTAYRAAVEARAEASRDVYELDVAAFEASFPAARLVRRRLVDGCFYLYELDLGERESPGTAAAVAAAIAGAPSCAYSLQGRKLALLPPHIDKLAAVRHLADRLGSSRVIAAGDSAADLSMLRGADLGLALLTGEIAWWRARGGKVEPHVRFVDGATPAAMSETMLREALADFEAGSGAR